MHFGARERWNAAGEKKKSDAFEWNSEKTEEKRGVNTESMRSNFQQKNKVIKVEDVEHKK